MQWSGQHDHTRICTYADCCHCVLWWSLVKTWLAQWRAPHSLPYMNTSLVLSLALHTDTHMHTITRREQQRLLCTSPNIFSITACLCLWPQSMCYWWNPFRHTHTHSLLNHPITHSETQVSYTIWSAVTNKKSLETDRLHGCSDLLSGVSSLSPHLNYFSFLCTQFFPSCFWFCPQPHLLHYF